MSYLGGQLGLRAKKRTRRAQNAARHKLALSPGTMGQYFSDKEEVGGGGGDGGGGGVEDLFEVPSDASQFSADEEPTTTAGEEAEEGGLEAVAAAAEIVSLDYVESGAFPGLVTTTSATNPIAATTTTSASPKSSSSSSPPPPPVPVPSSYSSPRLFPTRVVLNYSESALLAQKERVLGKKNSSSTMVVASLASGPVSVPVMPVLEAHMAPGHQYLATVHARGRRGVGAGGGGGNGGSLVVLWHTRHSLRGRPTQRHAVLRLSAADGAITSVAFSSDGALIALGTANASLGIWHVPTGRLQMLLDDRRAGIARGSINALAFHPDDRHVVGCGGSGELRAWRISMTDLPSELRLGGNSAMVESAPRLGETVSHDELERSRRLWLPQRTKATITGVAMARVTSATNASLGSRAEYDAVLNNTHAAPERHASVVDGSRRLAAHRSTLFAARAAVGEQVAATWTPIAAAKTIEGGPELVCIAVAGVDIVVAAQDGLRVLRMRIQNSASRNRGAHDASDKGGAVTAASIAAAATDGTEPVISFEEVRHIKPPPNAAGGQIQPPNSLVIDVDGSSAVTTFAGNGGGGGGLDCCFVLWDLVAGHSRLLETPQSLSHLSVGPTGPLLAAAWDHTRGAQKMMLTADWSGQILLWNTHDGTVVSVRGNAGGGTSNGAPSFHSPPPATKSKSKSNSSGGGGSSSRGGSGGGKGFPALDIDATMSNFGFARWFMQSRVET
eukprot:UC1_evm6s83